jgi:hypothetical protein
MLHTKLIHTTIDTQSAEIIERDLMVNGYGLLVAMSLVEIIATGSPGTGKEGQLDSFSMSAGR